jgi:hypothetical protein
VKIQKHHVVFSTALILVLTFLSLAGLFLADAASTNGPYDALAAHRVAVKGRLLGCFDAAPTGMSGKAMSSVCRWTYRYRGTHFRLFIGPGQPGTAYVDPTDPSIRMAKVAFDGGPREIVVDLVLASSFLASALLVATLHELHRHRRRRGGSRAHPATLRTP